MQKTVKEEITLEEIILKRQENDFKKLKSYFKDFYELKLKTRKAYEDIRKIKLGQDNDNNEIKEFYIEKDIENPITSISSANNEFTFFIPKQQ